MRQAIIFKNDAMFNVLKYPIETGRRAIPARKIGLGIVL
jgi:hypothetical protein